jgi:hypothetical protein
MGSSGSESKELLQWLERADSLLDRHQHKGLRTDRCDHGTCSQWWKAA